MKTSVLHLICTVVHCGPITRGSTENAILEEGMAKQTCTSDSTSYNNTRKIYENYNATNSWLYFSNITLHGVPLETLQDEIYFTVVLNSRDRTNGPDITYSEGKWWLRGKYSMYINGVRDLEMFFISLYRMSFDDSEFVGMARLDTQHLDTHNNTSSCRMKYNLFDSDGVASNISLEAKFGFEFRKMIFY